MDASDFPCITCAWRQTFTYYCNYHRRKMSCLDGCRYELIETSVVGRVIERKVNTPIRLNNPRRRVLHSQVKCCGPLSIDNPTLSCGDTHYTRVQIPLRAPLYNRKQKLMQYCAGCAWWFTQCHWHRKYVNYNAEWCPNYLSMDTDKGDETFGIIVDRHFINKPVQLSLIRAPPL